MPSIAGECLATGSGSSSSRQAFRQVVQVLLGHCHALAERGGPQLPVLDGYFEVGAQPDGIIAVVVWGRWPRMWWKSVECVAPRRGVFLRTGPDVVELEGGDAAEPAADGAVLGKFKGGRGVHDGLRSFRAEFAVAAFQPALAPDAQGLVTGTGCHRPPFHDKRCRTGWPPRQPPLLANKLADRLSNFIPERSGGGQVESLLRFRARRVPCRPWGTGRAHTAEPQRDAAPRP